jgi:hypothetical protein
VTVSFKDASVLWREGERRLVESEGRERMLFERVVDQLVAELRRRLGGAFTTEELASLYMSEGIDWCFDIAVRTAPSDPSAWDLPTVAGAAFARFVRQASDYGGGRQIVSDR